MFSLPSLNRKPSEMPQFEQNGRTAIGELSYQSGSRFQLTSTCFTI
jgi:hypothetical protein